jgi:hypothetical protein
LGSLKENFKEFKNDKQSNNFDFVKLRIYVEGAESQIQLEGLVTSATFPFHLSKRKKESLIIKTKDCCFELDTGNSISLFANSTCLQI